MEGFYVSTPNHRISLIWHQRKATAEKLQTRSRKTNYKTTEIEYEL